MAQKRTLDFRYVLVKEQGGVNYTESLHSFKVVQVAKVFAGHSDDDFFLVFGIQTLVSQWVHVVQLLM
jgi:hypothetical protein